MRIHHSIESQQQAAQQTTAHPLPVDFIPLRQEIRTHVSTRLMCAHIGRKEQTAREWACYESGPIRPIRIMGRLAWPVAEIRRLLGVT